MTRRLAIAVGVLAAGIILLVLVFFEVTPTDIAYQVSRCLRCH
jgi:hypothetical protein